MTPVPRMNWHAQVALFHLGVSFFRLMPPRIAWVLALASFTFAIRCPVPLCASEGMRAAEQPKDSSLKRPTSAALKSVFAHPPREFSSGPLWVWNDQLTEAQIVDTMRDLAGQEVKQVFVHPRPGLMTPYLSPRWFTLWKTALREAERLDMNVWIYDENSYPSGFAGGFVPDAMPEARGRGLLLREAKTLPRWTEETVAVYRLKEQVYENITEQVKGGAPSGEGRYLIATVNRAGNSPWHGGKSYVDLLYPGVTEKFLAITMEAYRREIGSQFGKRVPGVFTDEPNIRPAGGLPWTTHLPEAFEKRWGYRLVDRLPSLRAQVGDWRRVRHNYYQVLVEQFIEHWGKPYHDYCEKNGLEFTGHYWEHEWPNCIGVPDNMAMYAWHQRPAIDILMNQYREDTHAQFGNARAVRELASVANQLGRSRTLCEAYGAGGWDLRFEDMKRIGDWLYVLGVNTLDQHLSYITIRGARKRDHPQSFSYHEPWWNDYHISAEYFTRLSAALSHGEQVNSILVLEPTTTAWMYNTEDEADAGLKDVGNSFQELVLALEKQQVEYDIGCEDIIQRHGSSRQARLTVGRRDYSTVVLPPHTENLNSATMALIESFLQGGGTVIACDAPPAYIDGTASDRGAKAAQSTGWKTMQPAQLPLKLSANQDGFSLQRAAGDAGLLFHQRRQLADGELLFLVNTSQKSVSAGTFASNLGCVEQWDLNTGKTKAYPFRRTGSGIQARFELPLCGSLLLFIGKQTRSPVPEESSAPVVLTASGPTKISRAAPNVLVLDYVDITAGGETRTNVYFYRANQFAFQRNGMDRNPWDSAVQFRDELISRVFPADTGFEATYRFTIGAQPPGALVAVIERPDLYTIRCNGQTVSAQPGVWWLDKCFGKLDIGGLARPGVNTITIKAAPFTIYHELEPIYILGDFALKPCEKGFEIEAGNTLQLGRWNEQGHPFFSAGVTYGQEFDLAKVSGGYRVALPAWYGSVARVTVNGKPAGHIAYPPYECLVTSLLKPGKNRIEVQVIGTLKNTLGPHHNNPGLGSAWPGMFQTGPESGPPAGAKYSTVGYGLFEPFVLKQTPKNKTKS